MRLVVIEGPDFAGKSTVTSALLTALAAEGRQCDRRTTSLRRRVAPLINFVQARPAIDPRIRSMVFHVAFLLDYLPRQQVRPIVAEGHVHRMLAHDEVLRREAWASVFAALERWRPRADLAFYLDCPFHERRNRWLATHEGTTSTDRRDRQRFGPDRELTLKLEASLRRRCLADGYIVLDAARPPDEIAADIKDRILRAGGADYMGAAGAT